MLHVVVMRSVCYRIDDWKKNINDGKALTEKSVISYDATALSLRHGFTLIIIIIKFLSDLSCIIEKTRDETRDCCDVEF